MAGSGAAPPSTHTQEGTQASCGDALPEAGQVWGAVPEGTQGGTGWSSQAAMSEGHSSFRLCHS